MPGFAFYAGERLEELVAALETALADWTPPGRDPFEPDWIVVQSSGMERYLSLELARRSPERRRGVAANLRFLAPQRLLKSLLGYGRRDPFPFDREQAALLLYEALGEIAEASDRGAEDPDLAPLAGYLNDRDPLKRYQLACRISAIFDQYLIHRTEWVLAWSDPAAKPEGRSAGPDLELSPGEAADFGWQARLWRTLQGRMPGLDFAQRWGRFQNRLAELAAAPDSREPHAWREPDAIPNRIAWFGISHLPALHRRLAAELGRVADLRMFSLQPSPVLLEPGAAPEMLQSPLLRSNARTALDFVSELRQAAPELQTIDCFAPDSVAPEGKSNVRTSTPDPLDGQSVRTSTPRLLQKLQADLRADRNPENEPPRELPPDESIVVHNCYSPLREAEALRDWLLSRFAARPELRPDDVVILTPDLETYAPLIQAVFGNPEAEELRLPYTIADEAPGAVRDWNRAFLSILDLPAERFAAPAVAQLLETAPVRARFSLDPELVRYWLRQAEIRWGLDADDRERIGLPREAANTWRRGLDRLLLGHVMAADAEEEPTRIAGLAPCGAAEGEQAEQLGRLAEATAILGEFAAQLNDERSPQEWADLLNYLVVSLFELDSPAGAELDAALGELRDMPAERATELRIPLSVARAYLQKRLEQSPRSRGFLRGDITVGKLEPMRSIPFRIVCLLGMNEADFPRRETHPGFHLIHSRPRPGDPTRVREDRLLFLETLLCARDELVITYAGQRSHGARGEAEPSVPVSELLDTIDRSYRFTVPNDAKTNAGTSDNASGAPSAHIVRRHPLQAFHPDYFRNNAARSDDAPSPDALSQHDASRHEPARLFSYSRANCEAARQLLRADAAERRPFAPAGQRIRVESGEGEARDLEELLRFLQSPARAFLAALQIRARSDEESLEDAERFDLAGLDRYSAEETALELLLRHDPDLSLARERFAARMHDEDRLPHGNPGQLQLDEVWRESEGLFHIARERLSAAAKPYALHADLRLPGGERFTGRFNIWQSGACAVRVRASSRPARDLLALWLQLLVARVQAQDDGPSSGVLAWNRRKPICIALAAPPREKAAGLLASLDELMQAGLTRPLPIFAHTSFAYALARDGASKNDAAAEARALNEAQKTWARRPGQHAAPGEGEDPAIALSFRGRPPFPAEGETFFDAATRKEFTEHARELWSPVLECISAEDRKRLRDAAQGRG